MTPNEVSALLAAHPGEVVWLVGAGGCGMSGLGHLLLDLGFRIAGSDAALSAEIAGLRQRGAGLNQGHDGERLRIAAPCLVVHTPAVNEQNPELRAARQLGLPVVRRAVLLAALASRLPERVVCVAGMHGKTTTTALLAHALEQLGQEPGWAVGARVPQLSPHARWPRLGTRDGGWFVLETDESDGTLGLFQPAHALLLNVDAEHLDHFAGLEAATREFAAFGRQVSQGVFYCADDPELSRSASGWTQAISWGAVETADYRWERLALSGNPAANAFRVWHEGAVLGEFCLHLPGAHNVANAAAVIAWLHWLGFAPERIAPVLANFQGTARRQECLFQGELSVFDDYGHHPTEVRATLRAFREQLAGRLLVAFQPHRFTRTAALMEEFAGAFGDADQLWLTDIYAASEPPIPGITSAALAGRLRARGVSVTLIPEVADLPAAIGREARAGDLILFLGAGSITQAAHQLADALSRNTNHGD